MHSAFGRLEIVETGRRRRWSEDEKVRIVLESLAGPRLISATARRHGVSRAQLLTWRRKLRLEREAAAPGTFVPAIVAPEPPAASTPPSRVESPGASKGRMEIVLAHGWRVIVDAEVDSAALARVLDALGER
ncbi:IS66-like element accessory protein TnpA [Methylobacterium isbiliense]|uniref:IS66-like element accessory protein TnpA n=1 Tax=Methylobacterium isbiliense TaxID=315478 RepID=UPI001EDDFF20|nr:transposase [Methylobacterium isbiliense]MDN3626960.1 transposase [Methylobacterium isbiliense]